MSRRKRITSDAVVPQQVKKVTIINNTDQKQVLQVVEEIIVLLPRQSKEVEGSKEHYNTHCSQLIHKNVIKIQ